MISVLIPPDSSNHALAIELENSGARVFTWPGLEINAPVDDSHFRDAIENIFGYDWLIFKNARAAEHFMRGFLEARPLEELDDLRVLAIGADSTETMSEFHVHLDITLERFATGRVFDEIQSYVGDGGIARLNILVPSARLRREIFEDQLANAGGRVDSVAAYRTCAEPDQLARLTALFAGGGIDCVTFTSASAVDQFACLFDTDDLLRLLNGVTVVCVDQATAGAAKEFGLAHAPIPSKPTPKHLADLIHELRN
jgi:uroporphyrinogen III methyltransferase / synthase